MSTDDEYLPREETPERRTHRGNFKHQLSQGVSSRTRSRTKSSAAIPQRRRVLIRSPQKQFWSDDSDYVEGFSDIEYATQSEPESPVRGYQGDVDATTRRYYYGRKDYNWCRHVQEIEERDPRPSEEESGSDSTFVLSIPEKKRRFKSRTNFAGEIVSSHRYLSRRIVKRDAKKHAIATKEARGKDEAKANVGRNSVGSDKLTKEKKAGGVEITTGPVSTGANSHNGSSFTVSGGTFSVSGGNVGTIGPIINVGK